MSTGLSRVIGAVSAAAVLVGATASGGETVCDNPATGLYACDTVDLMCPTIKPDGFALRANYASYAEARDYLTALAADDFDEDDYLRIVDLGQSYWLDLSLDESASPAASGSVLAARITEGASERGVEKPAILVVCSVHSLEWAPSEVCIGYVDYLVKAANGKAPYVDDYGAVRGLLEDVEIWIITHATPGGRMYDEANGLQYKNYQWDHEWTCSSDWTLIPGSGACHEDTRYPGRSWSTLGVNVGNAFSEHWAQTNATLFSRGAIIGQPEKADADVIPELFNCYDADLVGPSDTICAAAFPDHPKCVEWFVGGQPEYGCFMFEAEAIETACTNHLGAVDTNGIHA
jgi:hypothetical protein